MYRLRTVLFLGILWISVFPAYAQFAEDNVASDINGNTAMGTLALSSVPNPAGLARDNTAVGDYALTSLTSGTSNTVIGSRSMLSSNGSNNTVVGSNALASSGSDNTAVGARVMIASFTGSQNTAVGSLAFGQQPIGTGIANLGNGNVAVGYQASFAVGTVSQDTAIGYQALFNDTAGYNTAVGALTMNANTSGMYNTALGASALQQNSTGGYNTAVGSLALFTNTASFNSAFGTNALLVNTTGGANTALGNSTLDNNTTGSNNTASGSNALFTSSTGNNNTADGSGALQYATTGGNSTAVGAEALNAATTGTDNIALGYQAGLTLTTGSNNIFIGHPGGGAAENNHIRIGTKGVQQTAFIAGIHDTALSGTPSAVYVDANGQLGVLPSSERFKTDIESMGESTGKIDQLRPVTFTLKADPERKRQYGLIAEEVAKVYPELVIHNDEGQISGVRYEELAPMLLNELQMQERRSELQAKKQAEQLEALQLRISELERSMQGRGTEK